MSSELFNANPTVFSSARSASSRFTEHSAQSLWLRDQEDTSDTESEGNEVEEIDQDEIFGTLFASFDLVRLNSFHLRVNTGLIRTIYDPEHPNTLEELRVVSAPQITIKRNHIVVEFTPTVPHCGMSTLIGKPTHPTRFRTRKKAAHPFGRPCSLFGLPLFAFHDD